MTRVWTLVLLASTALLSGCVTGLQKVPEVSEPQPMPQEQVAEQPALEEPAQQTQPATPAVAAEPPDTVCLVRHPYEVLRDDRLVEALAAGAAVAGLKTEVFEEGQVPSSCRLTLRYGLSVADGKVDKFLIQGTFEGKALRPGAGPVDPEGRISLSAVRGYTTTYLKSVKELAEMSSASSLLSRNQ